MLMYILFLANIEPTFSSPGTMTIAAFSIMATIIGFIIKLLIDQVIKRLDEIVSELKQLTKASVVQEQQIKDIQQRLNDHAGRIHTLEIKTNIDK